MQDRFKFRVWIDKYKKLVDVQRFGFGVIGDLTRKCAQNCEVIGNVHETKEDEIKAKSRTDL